jgi:hypothetical protein
VLLIIPHCYSIGTMSYLLKTRLSQMAQDRQDAMEAMRMVVLEKEATERWLGNEWGLLLLLLFLFLMFSISFMFDCRSSLLIMGYC